MSAAMKKVCVEQLCFVEDRREVCQRFLRGACSRQNCRFRHPVCAGDETPTTAGSSPSPLSEISSFANLSELDPTESSCRYSVGVEEVETTDMEEAPSTVSEVVVAQSSSPPHVAPIVVPVQEIQFYPIDSDTPDQTAPVKKPDTEVCLRFIRGNCKNKSCRFRHPFPEDPRVRSSKFLGLLTELEVSVPEFCRSQFVVYTD